MTSISAPTDWGADDRDEVAVGACDTGAVQECRIYLPSHNGVQPCFVGEQYCIEGTWSECLDPELVDANDGDSALSLDDISAGSSATNKTRSTSDDGASREDPSEEEEPYSVSAPPLGWANPSFTDDSSP